MSTKHVFVIKNQHNQYLDKHSDWHSGKDANALFRADHHDQALNTLLEVNAKDILLRGKIIEVELDEKKRPIVEVSPEAIALDKQTAIITNENEESTEQPVEENSKDE
jgi:hypothetical protein